MTTEQPKTAQEAAGRDQPQLPPGVVYSHPYNGSPYPHGGPPYPPFYSYPPPAEGQATENSVPPPPPPGFMMFPHPPPPGMVIAYTPPQTAGKIRSLPISRFSLGRCSSLSIGFAPPQPAAPQATTNKPKRKQVKMACTNCAAACKRCDEHRPCERCTKYGISDTCVDGQRKERKKGIKRGPYKRKNKDGTVDGDWSGDAASAPPPNSTQQVSAIQAIAHQFPNGEAFYPIYYPPGAAPYLPPVPPQHDGEGPPHGQPPLVPYYIPGGYPPPFAHYSPFLHGAPPPPPQAAQQQPASVAHSPPPQTVDPAVTNTSTETPASRGSPVPLAEKTAATNGVHAVEEVNGGETAGKKRKKGGDKSKKNKKSKSAKDQAATTVEPAALSVTAEDGAEGD